MTSATSRLFRELRRRHVLRMTAAYVVACFALLEAADLLREPLNLPASAPTFLVWLAVLGLVPVIVLTWIYELTPEGIRRTVGWEVPERAVMPGDATRTTRLLVLPFRILRPDAETDYIAFALPDAITCGLAGLQSLTVRSSLAAARFSGEEDLVSIGATAGVDAVLSGTVLRDGVAVRISTQLSSVPEGTLLWSQSERVEAAGLFEHQDALARRIVQSLRLPLTPAEARQLQRDVPATPRAYELYLRANQLSVRAGDWAAARDLYVACLEEDPNYAPAWARLGRCWRLIGNYTSDPAAQRRAFTEAESALRRALQLNPELAIATSLYAQFEISSGRSAEALRRLLERVRTHGADAVTMAALVHACRFCGLLHESVMAHDVARRLDPHVPTSVAHTWFMLGEYERARDTCDAADIGYLNAIALVALGRKREAVEWLLARPSVHDVDGSGVYLASLLAVLQGDRATAVVATQRALRAVTDGEAIFYMVRQLAHLGEHAAALEQLRRVVDSGFTPVFALEHDPWLRPVAAAPGFSAILHDAKERRAAAAMLIDQQGSTVLQAGSAKRDTDRERTPTAPHQAG